MFFVYILYRRNSQYNDTMNEMKIGLPAVRVYHVYIISCTTCRLLCYMLQQREHRRIEKSSPSSHIICLPHCGVDSKIEAVGLSRFSTAEIHVVLGLPFGRLQLFGTMARMVPDVSQRRFILATPPDSVSRRSALFPTIPESGGCTVRRRISSLVIWSVHRTLQMRQRYYWSKTSAVVCLCGRQDLLCIECSRFQADVVEAKLRLHRQAVSPNMVKIFR